MGLIWRAASLFKQEKLKIGNSLLLFYLYKGKYNKISLINLILTVDLFANVYKYFCMDEVCCCKTADIFHNREHLFLYFNSKMFCFVRSVSLNTFYQSIKSLVSKIGNIPASESQNFS